jgi:hypothetical protein
MCYMPSPPHSSWFDHPNSIWWEVQIIILLILDYSPLPHLLVLTRRHCSKTLAFKLGQQGIQVPKCLVWYFKGTCCVDICHSIYNLFSS